MGLGSGYLRHWALEATGWFEVYSIEASAWEQRRKRYEGVFICSFMHALAFLSFSFLLLFFYLLVYSSSVVLFFSLCLCVILGSSQGRLGWFQDRWERSSGIGVPVCFAVCMAVLLQTDMGGSWGALNSLLRMYLPTYPNELNIWWYDAWLGMSCLVWIENRVATGYSSVLSVMSSIRCSATYYVRTCVSNEESECINDWYWYWIWRHFVLLWSWQMHTYLPR